MRTLLVAIFASFLIASAAAQSSKDFSGTWTLASDESSIRDFSVPPARVLIVDQTAGALTITASLEPGLPTTRVVYPLDGTSQQSSVGDSTWNAVSKWEGSALLMNIIVSGPQDYSLFERWSRSGDGRLTITRTVNRTSGETESIFVYTSPQSNRDLQSVQTRSTESPRPPVITPPAQPMKTDYVVASGRRILMRLTNPVNTKRTMAGDRVYLQTAVPVFVNGRLIIPQGSYVTGTVTEAERAGRLKGKAALNLRFESVTLPNGTTRDFRGRAGSVDSQGQLDRTEGRIQGEGKGGDGTRRVAQTTAAGAGLGTIVGAATGHVGTGLGVGAAAGAAAGLASVFGSRGNDVVIPQGTTIELVLDRELVFTDEDLRQRVQ